MHLRVKLTICYKQIPLPASDILKNICLHLIIFDNISMNCLLTNSYWSTAKYVLWTSSLLFKVESKQNRQ